MRTVCGLFAVLFVLGPIGMGILFNVNAPILENDQTIHTIPEGVAPEEHGTRAAPEGEPTFLNFYFHRTDNSMNTSNVAYIPSVSSSDITFTLQNELIQDFLIQDPTGDFGMMVNLRLSGSDTLTIEVHDNSVDGPLLGSAGHTLVNANPGIEEIIYIPFETGWNHNYTFSVGHVFVIDFDFQIGAGQLHYDSVGRSSWLRLYCSPIPDISVETFNHYREPDDLFYPNDIDFPDERKKVIMEGTISDALGKWDKKFIDHVQVQFENSDEMNETRDADFNKNTNRYSYTWLYPEGQTLSGEYTITAHVFDEQYNEYTVVGTFNMSDYGVVLTSPDMRIGVQEGKYKEDAEIDVPLNSVINYTINVWNVGNETTPMNITTTGDASDWDWWLDGDDITTENGDRKGSTVSIDAGDSVSITLAVHSMDKEIGEQITIVIRATCYLDSSKEFTTFNTLSTVALKYDVQLEFLDFVGKTAEGKVELGEETSYDFEVSNTGGTNDTIWLDIGSPPSGWDWELTLLDGSPPLKQAGRYYVKLSPDEEEKYTITLTAPDSGTDDEFDLDVTGESEGSHPQTVSDKITITTILTMGIQLELVSDGVQDVDPEDDVDYIFRITNTGTKPADFSVSYSTPSGGLKSGDISFSETQLNNIASDDDDTFTMTVEPSVDVQAGNHSITVKVIRNNDEDVYEDKTVYTIVNAIPNLELIEPSDATPHLYGEASPGEDVEYQISFKNTGNVVLSVNIAISNLPEGWTVFFGNGSSVYSEEIMPGDTEEVDITLSLPDDAEGDETVDISISVIPSQGDSILIETHTKVEGSISQTFLTLLVPILLFVVIIVMVIVIYRRR